MEGVPLSETEVVHLIPGDARGDPVQSNRALLSLQKNLKLFEEEPDDHPLEVERLIFDWSYERFSNLDWPKLFRCMLKINELSILRHLELANVGMGSDEAELLANGLLNSSVTVQLHYLDVSGNPLGDKGALSLCTAMGNQGSLLLLSSLSLQHAGICDSGALGIAELLLNKPQISWLRVSGNPFIEAKVAEGPGRKALRDALQSRGWTLETDPRLCEMTPAEGQRTKLDKEERKAFDIAMRQKQKATNVAQLEELFNIVAKSNHKQLDRFVKESGLVIDTMHPEGFTVAHVAAAHGKLAMLKALQSYNVSLVQKTMLDLPEPTPRWFTSGTGRFLRFSLGRRSTPLFFAVCSGDAASVNFLVTKARDTADFPNSGRLYPHDLAVFFKVDLSVLPALDRTKAEASETSRLNEIAISDRDASNKKSAGKQSKSKKKKK